jgi:hemolysin activation/secretion protein
MKKDNLLLLLLPTTVTTFFSGNCIFTSPIAAQTPVQQVLPTPKPLPETEPLPPLEELLPSQQAPTQQQPSLEIPGEITVRDFKVVGSTVFSQAELAAVLEPFKQRPLSFARLLQVGEAITQLYFDRGYITSGAYIPPQRLEDNVVTIQVVEGRVESIEIDGLKRLTPSYIRSRIEIGSQKPLDRNKLLNALQLLQLNPLIDNLSVELAAGSRPGSSVISVRVKEADAFSAQLSLDNQRSPSVGTMRRMLDVTHNNLIGFGDRFDVGYINTDGSNTLNDLNYTIPLNPRNGTLSFSYSLTHSNIIEEPLNRLDIESDFRSYQITYRQPLWQTPTQEFALGLIASRQESKTFLDNKGFPLSAGAEDNGETKISSLRFFQDYTQRSSKQVFALRSEFGFGLNAFNATVSDNQPDSRFFVWRGQAQYLRLFGSATVLLLKADLQLANDALVPFEQYSVGGQLSVRGYRQDNLIGDNGFFSSVEIRTPILRIPAWKTTLQITPFFDFGTVWNQTSNTELDKNTLFSVGLGLRLLISNSFNARIDWGIPLVELESNGDTLQEQGLYFQVEYRFF